MSRRTKATINKAQECYYYQFVEQSIDNRLVVIVINNTRSGVFFMRKFLVIIMLSLTLVGCGYSGKPNHDPDTLQIMFLSGESLQHNEMIEAYINDLLADEIEEGLEINIVLTMPNFDRLTIELMNREVDLYVVEGWLTAPLLDPLGLTPLDQFYDQADPAVRDNYVIDNEEETDEYLYLVPLNEGSAFHEYTGFTIDEGFAAGIASASPHKEAALKLLEEWL